MDNDNNYDFEDDFDEYETYDEHYENTLKDEKYFDTILNITNDLKNYCKNTGYPLCEYLCVTSVEEFIEKINK